MTDSYESLAMSAVERFAEGNYCSEAILQAFNEYYELGITEDFMKIATAFGAGLGASKCCCGSLTGGVMVLSLLLGRTSADISEGPAFEASAALHDRFKAEYGATCCRVLTKPVEWGTPEHHGFCERYVRFAALATAEILGQKLGIYPRNLQEITSGGI